MKIFILLTLTCFTVSCLASELSNDQYSSLKTQTIMLESGISIDQCYNLRDRLGMDEKSCDLIKSHYVPFMVRAQEIKNRLPDEMRIGQHQVSVPKIAEILKEFPKTTDKEMYDMLTDKKK